MQYVRCVIEIHILIMIYHSSIAYFVAFDCFYFVIGLGFIQVEFDIIQLLGDVLKLVMILVFHVTISLQIIIKL